MTRTKNGKPTPEYKCWLHIRSRCSNPKNISYKHYGAKGIRVAAVWQNDFDSFLLHIGPRPSTDHSIDRIDSKGHYEPGNVRWATEIEQQNNHSRNKFLTYNDRTLTVSQWAREQNIPMKVLHNRLVTLTWSVARALSTPVRKCKKRNTEKVMNENK